MDKRERMKDGAIYDDEWNLVRSGRTPTPDEIRGHDEKNTWQIVGLLIFIVLVAGMLLGWWNFAGLSDTANCHFGC